MVYILDMVRALEREMLKRIRAQGLNMTPQIIVITRLIPEALGAPWSRHVQQAPASVIRFAQMWHCPQCFGIAVQSCHMLSTAVYTSNDNA